MKTESQVAFRLKEARKDLARTQKRFERYDNAEDMHALDELAAVIKELEWILSEA